MLKAILPLWAQTPATEPVRRSQPLLGTFVVITAYGPDRETVQHAISAAFAEIGRIDRLMSLYRPESELARLNTRAGAGPVEVSPELLRVVAMGQKIAALTDGSFDMTIAPLAKLWGFMWQDYRFPSSAELAPVLSRVNFRLVQLDDTNRSIQFLRPDVSLDLGGIAKGYAVDCAVAVLHRAGLTNVMVRAGGDLRVTGVPPGRKSWLVQLEDPAREGRRGWIELANAAISTSGDYENFFTFEGRRYSHILDPRTGLPVSGVAACTVLAPTCLESDAWATACFVYGLERSLQSVAPRFPMRFTLHVGSGVGQWVSRQAPGFPLVHWP